ncbi:MAG: ABC transporter ATP-binding protein [Mogibacterium sp.]|jgi:putative ABC transport system ATP-binding protein|nr:ABC transporter ATP-binding protein [Mogibacterium sp.]MBR3329916.1 ABC transporter ATP-binding protein [Mogibacterium sp.]
MKELLKVNNLGKGDILKDINLEIREGEMVAVMGPSGSGKSTLLYNVSGMDDPDTGEVMLRDTVITGLNEDEKAELRLKRMGFVFQQMNVLENLNIIDNIVLPAVHADRKHKKEYYERAMALMDGFHIGDLAERKTSEVSGGQLQRACICRSMLLEPEIIFADEPTGALNQTAATEVIDAFLKINRDGTTILMVTHDSRIASMCDRILYILDGQIRGELKLGKNEQNANREREQKTIKWLDEMGW